MFRKQRAPVDPGLAAIDQLERCIVRAHDDKSLYGASAEEVKRFRPAIVAQAKAITDQMRAEHRARNPQL
jgi:hypothetical protein